MKKLLNLVLCLGLAACTSTHQGTKSMNIGSLSINKKPLTVSVIPGEKIYGTAECASFLGITFRSSSSEAYGANLETESGNFAGDVCTRGAIYDAIVSSNADVIIAPQYATSGTGFLCIPFVGCVYRDITVTVSGRKGTYQYSDEGGVYTDVPAYQNQPVSGYMEQPSPVYVVK